MECGESKTETRKYRGSSEMDLLHADATAVIERNYNTPTVAFRANLQKAVESRQHHGHGQVVRVDEVQRLGHGNEDFVVHAVRYPLLFHPFRDGKRIALFNILLAEQNGRDKPDAKLDLLRTGDTDGTAAGKLELYLVKIF